MSLLHNKFTRFELQIGRCNVSFEPDPVGGGGGGGTIITPPGPTNIVNVPISGGLLGLTGAVIIPLVNAAYVTQLQYFDTTTFDTENDATIIFRQEEVEDGCLVTIKRLRIKYRNLGICTFVLNIDGMFSSKSVNVKLGDPNVLNGQLKGVKAIADGRLYNAYVDVIITDEAPQLSITRSANSGPISIVGITALGDKHVPAKE